MKMTMTKAQTAAITRIRNAGDETIAAVVEGLNSRTRRALVAKGLLSFTSKRHALTGGWNGVRYTEKVHFSFHNITVK